MKVGAVAPLIVPISVNLLLLSKKNPTDLSPSNVIVDLLANVPPFAYIPILSAWTFWFAIFVKLEELEKIFTNFLPVWETTVLLFTVPPS